MDSESDCEEAMGEYNDYEMRHYVDVSESKASEPERSEKGANWFKRAEHDPDFELKINRSPVDVELRCHQTGENEYQMARYLGRVFPGMVIEVIERTASGFISLPMRGCELNDWLTSERTSPRQVIRFLRGLTIFLYQSGLVHGDLHARNIFIESPTEFQLFDFETSYLLADPVPLFDIWCLLAGTDLDDEKGNLFRRLKRWIKSHSLSGEADGVTDLQNAPLEEWYLLLDEIETNEA